MKQAWEIRREIVILEEELEEGNMGFMKKVTTEGLINILKWILKGE